MNLSTGAVLEDHSVSALRYVEVYRIDEKPESLENFAESLITVIDLKTIERIYPSAEEDGFRPTTQTSTVCFYEEKIKTNKTYYYIFRFLNEHRLPGKFSPIQVLKMIDDGGYKYIETDIILESELVTATKYENPSLSFQKIFELVPNINQIEFDTSNVDYEQDAYSQISNVAVGTVDSTEVLWGKRFKIRLNSKKTGKKIDLNITYNLKDSV